MVSIVVEIGAVYLSDLSVVCDIRNGFGQVPLMQLPSGCTAAASSNNNLSKLNLIHYKST